jgi:uncharacterized protein with PIN domain
MSEIERAIKDFKDFKQAGYTHSELPSSWHIELALAALREKAERERGCEYCNSRFGIASHHVNQAGMQAGTNRNAKCCPECGKRLEVEP